MIYYDIEHQFKDWYIINYRCKWWHRWRPVMSWFVINKGSERPELCECPKSMKYIEALEFCKTTTAEMLLTETERSESAARKEYAWKFAKYTKDRETLKQKGIVIL